MGRKIILYELNEVPFRILEEYIRFRPQSHFARLLPACRQAQTLAEDEGLLSPWFTWPSLHRGVSNRDHGIQDFGQDLREVDRSFPPLWRLLAGAGIRTGVCGSLHSYPLPDDLANYAFYLPDTFAAGSEAFPEKLVAFQEFNLNMARASGRNVDARLPWQAALDLLRAAPSLGLRTSTFASVGLQLARERINPARTARRRSFQSVLAFDVFMRCLRDSRPDFCTFFTNHVAAAMHRYWAAAFPSDYSEFGYDEGWVNTYAGEIFFAMDLADTIFGQLTGFADRNPGYSVWVATSMGQAATSAIPVNCQLYVTSAARFMVAMGVSEGDWKALPCMLPQFNVRVSQGAAKRFRSRADSLAVDGVPINFREAEQGFFSLDFGHANLENLSEHTLTLEGECRPFAEMGLENVVIEDQTGSNAYHIPEGVLLTYDPKMPGSGGRGPTLSTLDLAPAILRNYGLPVPGYMNAAPRHEAIAA